MFTPKFSCGSIYAGAWRMCVIPWKDLCRIVRRRIYARSRKDAEGFAEGSRGRKPRRYSGFAEGYRGRFYGRFLRKVLRK